MSYFYLSIQFDGCLLVLTKELPKILQYPDSVSSCIITDPIPSSLHDPVRPDLSNFGELWGFFFVFFTIFWKLERKFSLNSKKHEELALHA